MDSSTRRDFAAELAGFAAAPSPAFEPAYLRLERSGELERRARALRAIYKSCRLCPRRCGVNRLKGETGVCRSAAIVKVASFHPHHGEEQPISGRNGSGTVFFSHCNLLCVFCQNWTINHRGDGSWIPDDELGDIFVDLQRRGCHNINLVTPTHVVPNIVAGLRYAIARGLRVPLVYNCGGYEPLEVIRLLDGIVDIYLPDFKYMDGAVAGRLSHGAGDYPNMAAAAIVEMHRQVGELRLDSRGIALRGLLIRHLVLPGNLAGTDKFVRWVAEQLTPGTWVNMMPQYHPDHEARRYPEISRRITQAEFDQALQWATDAGLRQVIS
jgi:putative pyruvate formate lyase activating enzyme